VSAGPGTISRQTLRFGAPALRHLEWPYFDARGAKDGPHLAIIAGIHGCEYSSISGAVELMRGLDPAELCGRVTAVPIVNLESYRQRTPFVSPADGTLSEFGALDADTLLQAKGRRYSLAALLGETGEHVDALLGGSYCTVYLSPRDYHRVHAPLDAALTRTRYIPGRRFSVSLATAASIDRIFCRNERAIC